MTPPPRPASPAPTLVAVQRALAEDFPALRAALGADAFAALCARYVAAHPSDSPSLGDLGRHLPDFLRASASVVDQPAWLADLAALEWSLVVAFTAPDDPVLTRDHLTELAPGAWPDLLLRPVRSLHRHETSHAVDDLRDRLLAGEAVADAGEPVSLRVWRQGDRVFHRRTGELERGALERIHGGCRFEDLGDWLAERVAPERASEEALELLLRWLEDSLLLAPPAS